MIYNSESEIGVDRGHAHEQRGVLLSGLKIAKNTELLRAECWRG